MTVAVLFARADSVYKTMPDCDVYDMERDARTYDGPFPVVAHPPCRAWGNFAMFAKPRPDERNLARLSVALVREFGGVLEHPFGSKLWPAQRLPVGQERDQWGGWTLVIDQHWWGHRAQKRTKLYIVGIEPGEVPEMPMKLGRAEFVVGDVGRATSGDDRPEIGKAEREHTPPPACRMAGGAGPALRKGDGMKCTACNRPISTPSLTLAGMVFGPVCARRVLLDAGQMLQPKPERQDAVQRDTLTPDIFQDSQEDLECNS